MKTYTIRHGNNLLWKIDTIGHKNNIIFTTGIEICKHYTSTKVTRERAQVQAHYRLGITRSTNGLMLIMSRLAPRDTINILR